MVFKNKIITFLMVMFICNLSAQTADTTNNTLHYEIINSYSIYNGVRNKIEFISNFILNTETETLTHYIKEPSLSEVFYFMSTEIIDTKFRHKFKTANSIVYINFDVVNSTIEIVKQFDTNSTITYFYIYK